MSNSRKFLVLFLCVNSVFSQGVGSGTNGNLRLCVVESRGQYKRAAKFCPVLDEAKVGIECVLGTDRLDCLRRMGKGTVDFGVFNPEDLIAAQWAQIDVLVTNELRKTQTKFERNFVAVVNRRIIPEGSSTVSAILRNRTLCHAGLESDPTQPLSDKLSEYLEGLVTEKLCDGNFSMAENRIKAMADYYGRACKASDWVDDKERDLELKSKYPSLCAACARSCNRYDRYFGKVGSLLCLSEGSGDVAFADHTYVRLFPPLTTSPNFAYLCRDGTSQPLNTTEPCIWLNKPWPVIVAKRKTAAAVGNLTRSLIDKNVTVQGNWHSALAALFESNRALPEPLQPPHAPLDYLDSALGYREAYSQNGCTPPRHLRVCTTSVLEKHKCDWLSEAAAVHGVEPPLQCESRASRRDCLQAVGNGSSDVTMADSDWLVIGARDFSVTPLLHETTPIVERMSTVLAYVKKDSQINKMADLRGKRAAFPRYDGLAWHSVLGYLKRQGVCPTDQYFSEICAPGVESYNLTGAVKETLTGGCIVDGGVVLDGEMAALRSLVEGKSDVAFVSVATYNMYAAKQIQESWSKNTVEIVPVCPEDNKKYCFLSWSNIGHVFASTNITSMKRHEIKNAFTRLDQLFGKQSPFHWAMFSMYGPFNHQLNVLFHNNTKSLETDAIFGTHPYDKLPLNYERDLLNVTFDSCQSDFTQSLGVKITPAVFVVLSVLVCHFMR